jgi:hypothetical protein
MTYRLRTAFAIAGLLAIDLVTLVMTRGMSSPIPSTAVDMGAEEGVN